MRRVAGFTLIEVMITAFIMATGLIAVVAMQGLAKQSTVEARQRTTAMMVANDIVERMRLNADWLRAGGGNSYAGVYGNANLTRPSCSQDNELMNGCQGQRLRDHDLYHWQRVLQGNTIIDGDMAIGGLPEARGCIEDAANGWVRVVVAWKSRHKILDAAAGSESYRVSCGTAGADRRQIMVESYVW